MIKKILLSTILLALPLTTFARDGSNMESEPGDMRQSQVSNSGKERSESIKQNRQEKENELREKAEAKKEEVRKKRCDKATALLEQKSTKVEERSTNIDQKLVTVEQRWQRIIDRAESKNVDASKLEEALNQFKQYHATFNTDMQALRQLHSSKTRACGEQGEANNLKQQIRDAHTKVLQDAKQLRNFRKQTQKDVIVPLLKEMAKASKTESSDDKKTDSNTFETSNSTGANQ